MRYDNAELSDKLASRYVLGVLKGRARGRFERLLKYKPALREGVAEWQARLAPLADFTPEVAPPLRVWRAIEARIAPRSAGVSWSLLRRWQSLAAVASVVAIVFAMLAFNPEPAPVTIVAVLADSKAKPTMVVSWSQSRSSPLQQLRVQMLAPVAIPADRSLELWMLPGGDAAPISLGIVSAQQIQTVTINEKARSTLPTIPALAISVEPAGGSKTGLPTGPVIASGPSIQM